MKKKAEKHKYDANWIDLRIFPVYVAFTTKKKTFDYMMDWMNVTNPPVFVSEAANAMTHYFAKGPQLTIVVTMFPKDKDMPWEVYVGLMAHECMHVVQEIQEKVGRRSDRETEAYLIQRLLMDCLSIYKMECGALAR